MFTFIFEAELASFMLLSLSLYNRMCCENMKSRCMDWSFYATFSKAYPFSHDILGRLNLLTSRNCKQSTNQNQSAIIFLPLCYFSNTFQSVKISFPRKMHCQNNYVHLLYLRAFRGVCDHGPW